MKKVPLDKVSPGMSGKDILKLVSSREKSGGGLTLIPPSNENESTLYDIWKDLLGHQDFGIEDDFFKIGGSSIKGIQLISRIHRGFGTELLLTDVFSYPTIRRLSSFIQESKKTNHNTFLFKQQNRPGRVPLSFSQERLWFIDRLEGSLQYHIPAVIRLKGMVNMKALEFALQEISGRHEALRTVFHEENGQVYQEILAQGSENLIHHDGKRFFKDKEALHSFIESLIHKPFDLAVDLTLRADLVMLDENEFVLVIVLHHISSDGWSIQLIIREVVELYSSYCENRAAELPELTLQYADYAIGQRIRFEGGVLLKQLEYWKGKLAGNSPLEMPVDFNRPALRGINGTTKQFRIEKELVDKIYGLDTSEGTTLYMRLLAAFNLLLYRYSGQEDISVGASVANRPLQELENLIGFFVNTLTFRNRVNPGDTFSDLVQAVKATTIEAYEHQDVPFEKVVEAVVKERDPSRSPLFQVMFVFINTPGNSKLHFENVDLILEDFITPISKFDFTFHVREIEDGLNISVEYSTDLYRESTIAAMMEHYKAILSEVAADPGRRISEISMLSEPETRQLTTGFNTSEVTVPKEISLPAIFAGHASNNPNSDAVMFEGEKLSYSELDQRANQLAHTLIDAGVKPGTLVPLYMDRGIDMIAAMLGIMKAGCAYVPIDRDFPRERIEFMIEDTAAKFVVCDRIGAQDIGYLDVKVITMELTTGFDKDAPACKIKPQDPAYVIYTSGSTGKPKGVIITHHNLTDYIFGLHSRLNFGKCRSFALVSSIATDLGNTVIFSSWFNAGVLHLFSKQTVSDAHSICQYFDQHPIDCLKIVPSHWKALCTDSEMLLPKSLLIFGGELLEAAVVQSIQQRSGVTIVNHYGPTETTIGKLLHEVQNDRVYDRTIPIGTPFGNTAVYVISPDKQLCPKGVPGELFIGGEGLAKAYLNLPQLTLERFIDNPYKKGQKIYATGDLVKYNQHGEIEYLGRTDDQVKIRGYRIELGEIETAIAQSDLVQQAVVLLKLSPEGSPRLTAYILTAKGYQKQDLLDELKLKLPEYMIPSKIMELESFPLLANGKVDRKALPDPDTDQSTGQYIAPRNQTEEVMAELWQEILEVDKVGMSDDFFELGGHSLLAIRLVSAIRKAFEVEMPIGDIFDYPTIGQLAERIAEQSGSEVLPPITKTQTRPERIPLSFSQERLWFIDQLEGSIQYHNPVVLSLKGVLDVPMLESSIKDLIERHEVLRTVVVEDSGRGYQIVMPSVSWKLEIVSHENYKNNPKGLENFIRQLIDKPFDLSKDFMIRGHLISLEQDDHILIVTLHHIASDRWSTSVMVKEFAELYNSKAEPRAPELSPINIQYADYSIWQRTYLTKEVLDKILGYWKDKLKGFTQLEMPLDFPRTSVWSAKGALLTFHIEKEVSDALSDITRKHGATLFMTMLAAFKALVYRYTSQDDISIGTSIANRKNQDIENLIGFFVNTLTLRTKLNGSEPFTELLKSVKTTTLEAYEHLDAPYEKVVDAMVSERDMSRNALFQILFVMHNTPEIPELNLKGIQLEVLPIAHDVSRFDFSIFLTETASGINGQMQYCTDLFKEETMERLIGHYQVLLKHISQNPHQKIDLLQILPNPEKTALLNKYNKNVVDYSSQLSIIDLFEQQAAKNPNKPAIVFEGNPITYAELNDRSNQLANNLLQKGVKPETPVPLFLERGAEMIVAILGIMKSGCAYVPIDPEFPKDRIAFMLSDTAAGIVISSKELRKFLPEVQNFEVIEPDSWKENSKTNPGVKIQPEHLAYLIYTSGSTGEPKGVMIEHKSIIDYVLGLDKEINIKQCDSFALLSSIATDLGNTVIFGSLLTGGILHLFSKEKSGNIEWLHDYFSKHKVDCIKIVPSHWKALSLDDKPLLPEKLLIFGGEAMDRGIPVRIRDSGALCRVVNHYGPTETTIGKLLHQVDLTKEYSKNVPIGKAFSKTSTYVLNSELELCPIGVPGQLYIGGDGLARGYLNNKGLTDEKFIKDPYSQNPGNLIYATGDLVKRMPDGDIDFLGRVDQQVKIRGYRVEPGEIESLLKQSPLVNEAAVIAKEDENGSLRLVAYILPNGNFDKEAISFSIQDKLPEYMLPSVYVKLESVPLTPNGKLDRKALPDVVLKEESKGEFFAPQSEIEKTLAEIWMALLKTEKASIHDNFFDFGGDSIVTLQFVSRVRRAGYELQPKDVFVYQTIAGLSSLIEQKKAAREKLQAEPTPVKGACGLLPVQQWFFERGTDHISHYNQSVLLKIDKTVTEKVLNGALQQLLSHHDSLRMVFKNTPNGWTQEYSDTTAGISQEEIISSADQTVAAEIETMADKYQRSLNIENGELFRFVMIKTRDSDSKNRLLIIIHHLVIDGVSWRILLEDLDILIRKAMNNEVDDLGKKGDSYGKWFETLGKYSATKKLLSQKDYWSKISSGAGPLPVDMEHREPVRMRDRLTVTISLNADYTRKLLQEAPKAYQTEINDLLLLALTMTIGEWSHSSKVLIGMEGHGRETIEEGIDISRTIGWFTTIYPVLLSIEPGNLLDKNIKSVKEQLRGIPDKGIGFGVLKYILKEPSLQKPEPSEIMFNYLGQSDNTEKEAKWLSKADESTGVAASEEHIFFKKLVLNCLIQSGKLVLNMNYSAKHYAKPTIQKLLETYLFHLKSIIDHCVEIQGSGAKVYTPADFGLSSKVSVKELDEFLKEDSDDDIMSF